MKFYTVGRLFLLFGRQARSRYSCISRLWMIQAYASDTYTDQSRHEADPAVIVSSAVEEAPFHLFAEQGHRPAWLADRLVEARALTFTVKTDNQASESNKPSIALAGNLGLKHYMTLTHFITTEESHGGRLETRPQR